ncbi:MAG: hypothetical protein ACI865_000441 [Flavobacteriaceae bacterium]|jgi:uncharacterized protein (DUF2141 family)
MKNTFLLFVILVGLLFTQLSAKKATSSSRSISLRFGNVRNNHGYLYIYLYQNAKQYPFHPYKHFKVSKKNVANKSLRFTIDCISKGMYAITAIDDENGNKDLDRFWGVPTEGYAFSNNPKTWNIPSYKRLIFGVYKQKNYKYIKMQYV